MITSILRESPNDKVNKLTSLQKKKIKRGKQKKSPLHIVYVMNSTQISGGSKIIFQQANEWVTRGHRVTILAYGPKPSWYPIACSYIQVPSTVKLATCIPNCDVIVVTYYTHIAQCVQTGIAPVIYFEQGDRHLFDYQQLSPEHQAYIQSGYRMAHYIVTVSHEASKTIQSLFKRRALVMHNGLDTEVFCPISKKKEDSNPYMLIMGNDRYAFKGIEDLIKAYKQIKEELPELELYYITPEEPTIDVSAATKVFVAPTEQEIVSLYQEARAFVQGSYYEAFGLPVLEAMACGCPVITTDCIGIRDYVSHENNAIMVTTHSPKKIADAVLELENNLPLRRRLIRMGLKTARQFRWKKVMKEVIATVQHIAAYELEPTHGIQSWTLHVAGADFSSKEDYAKFLQYIKTTPAGKVYIPITYDINEDISLGRWTLAGIRDTDKEEAYCYVSAKKQLEDFSDEARRSIYMSMRAKDYQEAIHKILASCNGGKDGGELRRWLIYGYIRTHNLTEAYRLLHLETDGGYRSTDDYYLEFLYHMATEELNEAWESIRQIREMGDAIYQEEFFADVSQRVGSFHNTQDDQQQQQEVKPLAMEEIYDFALQLYENGLYKDAIYYFETYTQEEDKDQEKCIDAIRKIYLSYYYQELYKTCRKYCYKVFEYTKPRAEECCFIGFTYMKDKRLDEAIFWYQEATKLKLPRNRKFTIDKEAWTWKPYLQLCLCYYEKGDLERAYSYHRKARKINPHDEHIQQNELFFKSNGFGNL